MQTPDNHYAVCNLKLAAADCIGLRRVHERKTSARRRMPFNNAAWLTTLFAGTAASSRLGRLQAAASSRFGETGAELHAQAAVRSNRTASEAHVLAQASCSTSNST